MLLTKFSPILCILSSTSNIAISGRGEGGGRGGGGGEGGGGSMMKRDLQQEHHIIKTSVTHLFRRNRIHSNVTKITG